MKRRLQCEKCGKNYKMLGDGTCFFCDQKKWYAFFNKGKNQNKSDIKIEK